MESTLTLSTPSEREICMTRVFDAPRSRVFEALTRPDLVARWLLGPPGWSMTVCEIDPRPEGAYRYVWRHEGGSEMGLRGRVREIQPPERMVCTETFEFGCDSQSGEQVATTHLTEQDGRTTLTMTILYPSKEARDQTLASGMEHGVEASHDRLAALLASG